MENKDQEGEIFLALGMLFFTCLSFPLPFKQVRAHTDMVYSIFRWMPHHWLFANSHPSRGHAQYSSQDGIGEDAPYF
jgi:hypothetical protein